MKTYSQKLSDPRWQRKRLEILQRDNFSCRRCNSQTQTLHVHHVRYLRNREPWDYRDYYLVTLCKDCHTAEECEIKEANKRNCLPAPACESSRLSLNVSSAPEKPVFPLHGCVGRICVLVSALRSEGKDIAIDSRLLIAISHWVEGVLTLHKMLNNPDDLTDDEADAISRSLCCGHPSDENLILEMISLCRTALDRKDAAIREALKATDLSRASDLLACVSRVMQLRRMETKQILESDSFFGDVCEVLEN